MQHATTTTKRRPIRGLLWGVILGLGLALIAIGQGLAALGTWPPFLLLLAGIVLGGLWSTLGPAKGGGPVTPDTPSAPTAPVLDPDPAPDPESGASPLGA